jgi:hypothetical protein
MYKNIKAACFITAICFIMSCLTALPAFASSTDPKAAAGDSAGPAPDPTTTPPPEVKEDPKPQDDESLWYSGKISMKKEHQKLLWDYCKKRNLDYIDMLSLIYVESNFNEKCSSGKYKGYFQISTAHGPNMSKTLNTENKPLDGAININWGTALYSWILADKRVYDLEGQAKRDAALSIYQRGAGGYDKYGLSKSFLKRFYAKRTIVCSYFEQA